MNKKAVIDRAVSIFLALSWMLVIFLMSHQSADRSNTTSGELIISIASVFNPKFDTLSIIEQENIIADWQRFVRKAAHFTEYAVLGFLCANALRTFKMQKNVRYILPAAVTCLYAVSDELHQLTVEGRSCQVKDMVLDTAGGIVGTAAFFILLWIFRKITKKHRRQQE